MPYFGQDIFPKANEKGPSTEKVYRKALQENRRLSREVGIDPTLRENELYAIIFEQATHVRQPPQFLPTVSLDERE